MQTKAKTTRTIRGGLFIGGQSKRMGQPKSLLCKNNTTLGVYLADLLTHALGSPAVLIGKGVMGHPWHTQPQVEDAPYIDGPLAGFTALQQDFAETAFIVLAVDLYFFDEEALTWLLSKTSQYSSEAIWPKFSNRPFGEPFAAYYPGSALRAMAQAAASGETAIHRALPRQVRHEPLIPKRFLKSFTNVNRPEDLPYSMKDL